MTWFSIISVEVIIKTYEVMFSADLHNVMWFSIIDIQSDNLTMLEFPINLKKKSKKNVSYVFL